MLDGAGNCFGAGCGHTGWVLSQFNIQNAGNYLLEFGVVNVGDSLFNSGLAFSGITVDGVPVDPSPAIPEPKTYAMMLAGLGLLGFMARRKKI